MKRIYSNTVFVSLAVAIVLFVAITVGILLLFGSYRSIGVTLTVCAGALELVVLPIFIVSLCAENIVLYDDRIVLLACEKGSMARSRREVFYSDVRSIKMVHHGKKRENFVLLILSVLLFHDAVSTGSDEYYEYIIHINGGADLSFNMISYSKKNQEEILAYLKRKVKFS